MVGQQWDKDALITIKVMKEQTIKFLHNGDTQGMAYKDIQLEQIFRIN